MTPRFATAHDFKASLEARLRRRAFDGGRTLERERQLVVFERFLARLFHDSPSGLVVKGGLAIELRTSLARTTKDVDLGARGDPERFEQLARDAGRRDAGDFLAFEVERHPRHPEIRADGMQYAGQRYRVQGQLAGKLYGNAFSLDVAFGEPALGPAEVIRGRAGLDFAGVDPPELRVYPRTTHLAEKVHAYTLVRPSLNSRVKDLPDIGILASLGAMQVVELCAALEQQTFRHRATHPLPAAFPRPPEEWRVPYGRMAHLDRLRWVDLDTVHGAVARFLDPALQGDAGKWDPASWLWQTGDEERL